MARRAPSRLGRLTRRFLLVGLGVAIAVLGFTVALNRPTLLPGSTLEAVGPGAGDLGSGDAGVAMMPQGDAHRTRSPDGMPPPRAAPRPADPRAVAEPAPPAITVVEARRDTLSDIVVASGLVRAVEQVSVQPRIEGQAIETLLVDVGDTVEKDQVLARLSTDALKLRRTQVEAQRASAEAAIAQADAQIREAESGRDLARSTEVRTTQLAKRGLSSRAVEEQAVSAAESADARVATATQAKRSAEAALAQVDAQMADIDLQLARTEIRAPVAGLVSERNALVGAVASASGKALFVILRDGLLELNADIAEQDVLKVEPGDPATIRIAGLKGPLEGTVRLVEPTVNAQTRLGLVRITIADPRAVKWGMFAEGTVTVERREGVVLPVSAVQNENGRTVALKVVDGIVRATPVTTGIRQGDRIEIVEGVAAGDSVVAKAGAFVRDGDRITPVTAPAAVADSRS